MVFHLSFFLYNFMARKLVTCLYSYVSFHDFTITNLIYGHRWVDNWPVIPVSGCSLRSCHTSALLQLYSNLGGFSSQTIKTVNNWKELIRIGSPSIYIIWLVWKILSLEMCVGWDSWDTKYFFGKYSVRIITKLQYFADNCTHCLWSLHNWSAKIISFKIFAKQPGFKY